MNLQKDANEQRKQVVFDESGETVAEMEAAVEGEEVAEQVEDTEAPLESENQDSGPGKYRIGDKSFDTQEEALAYATSQVSALETENQVADAYRQGIRDAIAQAQPGGERVTPQAPPPPAYNTEELYADPQAFLDKYAQRIKTETLSELDQRTSLQAQSDQIWREFTDRHPSLSDFRSEVEDFVSKNRTEVRAVIATKGAPSSYDFIATKIKSRFESYANAVKPKRALPNARSDASPSSKSERVTQNPAAKKPLSFAEQLRSIRKRT